ncbi:hypothetical protein DM02DRAFT_661331 [Periconia macrospinosa]|uniref:Uncharacterized protein n=1 Tax=Periconia macrospinosa TaxID=97972 RepID=A0A2V1D7P0_9PLEO|nr:hypothetical protein DM02DRAFT_661331 [Periconia macrospinosa]
MAETSFSPLPYRLPPVAFLHSYLFAPFAKNYSPHLTYLLYTIVTATEIAGFVLSFLATKLKHNEANLVAHSGSCLFHFFWAYRFVHICHWQNSQEQVREQEDGTSQRFWHRLSKIQSLRTVFLIASIYVLALTIDVVLFKFYKSSFQLALSNTICNVVVLLYLSALQLIRYLRSHSTSQLIPLAKVSLGTSLREAESATDDSLEKSIREVDTEIRKGPPIRIEVVTHNHTFVEQYGQLTPPQTPRPWT